MPALTSKLQSPLLSLHGATLIVGILRDIGDTRAAPALVREFNRRRLPRNLVIGALATCGDTRALIPLLRVVGGQDDEQRYLALTAIESFVDRRAIVPLLPVLKVTDERARLVAVRMLDGSGPGGMGGPPEKLALQDARGGRTTLAGPWHWKKGPALSDLPEMPQAPALNQNMPTVLFNWAMYRKFILPVSI